MVYIGQHRAIRDGADQQSCGRDYGSGECGNYRWFYQGPAINANAAGPLVDTATALQQVFDWFNTNGGKERRQYVSAIVPGFNMTMPEQLTSPYSIEYAGGVSRMLGRRASFASMACSGITRISTASGLT